MKPSLLLLSIFLESLALAFGQATPACPKPSIYFTNDTSIFCIAIGTDGKTFGEKYPAVHLGHYRSLYRYQLRPVTLDVSGQRMFWLDFYRKEIFQADLGGKKVRVALTGITGVIEGIAYDWVSKYIYMTDSIHDWIIVASLQGNYRTVIVRGTSRPRGIAVDPINRYVFWADSGVSMIERCRLDGSERTRVINTNLSYDISLDITNKRIYFCDNKRLLVCSCDYFGKDLQCTKIGLIYTHLLFSLAYYPPQNRAFVTDIYKANVRTYDPIAKTSTAVTEELHSTLFFNSQIRIFDDSAQPAASSPCQPDSCSHFCFAKSASSVKCGCPLGMKMSENNRDCKKLNASVHMYFADANIGRLYHLTQYDGQLGSHLEAVPTPKNSTYFPVAIAYDPIEDMLYWSELLNGQIHRIKSDGSRFETIASNVRKVEGMTIDYIGKLLFWTDNDRNVLEVSRLNGSYRTELIDGLDRPRAVLAYPEKGLLFFTDWGLYPKVEMMYMDGSNRKTIGGTGTNVPLVWPNALALDKIDQTLYYVDAYYDLIISYNLRSKKSKVILAHDDGPSSISTSQIVFRISTRLEHPFGMAHDSEYLYWTDWKTGAVYRVNKYSAEKVELVAAALFRPEDIHSYRLTKKTGYKREFIFDYSSARCSDKCDPNVLSQITHSRCKPSFKSVWTKTGCYKCNKYIYGVKGQRCECKDKASCLHRVNQISSCPRDLPNLNFGVRECEEEVRPGTCPVIQFITCGNQTLCNSDSECTTGQKCCDTGCGKLCATPIAPPPLPCESTHARCSICLSLPNRGKKCVCPKDYVLRSDNMTCTKKKNPCDGFNLCQNGGKCLVRDDSIRTACECPLSHTGRYCETHILCYPNPCHLNGTCYYTTQNGTQCRCPPYATGRRCQEFKPCTTPHCKNGGTCIQAVTGYHCYCSARYTGINCENDKCSNITCQNGGTCVVRGDGIPRCRCKPEYFGEKCEVPSPCLGNPCGRNGRCDYQLPSLVYRCNCYRGYYGQNCSKAIPCYQKCQNGGTCMERGDDRYSCECPPNYRGEFCETRIYCTSGICKNRGICSETGSGYKCTCVGLVTGRNCEHPIPCVGNRCDHGACEPVIDGGEWKYRCKCDRGYTGTYCDTLINYCASNPCLNGGSCRPRHLGYECRCTPKYIGTRCQTEKCDTEQCKNGGACLSADAAACTCKPSYTLRTCNLYIGNNIYLLAFVPNEGVTILERDFRAVMSGAFSRYCQAFNVCPNRNSVRRRKRDSPPIYPNFSDNDVLISKGYPTKVGVETHFNFAVLAPESATGNDNRRALDQNLIHDAVRDQQSYIERRLGATIVKSDPVLGSQEGKKKEESGGSKAVSAGVSIGVLFVLVPLLAFVLYTIYKRKRSKSQQAGPVAFSNNTFAPEATPEFLDYSQDPRAVPTEAPPEYDNIGYKHSGFQDQPPPMYDAAYPHLQNPLYGYTEDNLATGGHYENLPAKEQEAVQLPPYQEPITVKPMLTDEGTGFENPMYTVANEEEKKGAENGKVATVGIYTTLENEEDEQAGPLPSKMPLPDSTA